MNLNIDEDFPSHPKTVRLCAALQNPVAWAYMIKLWAWARKHQKDGDLTTYEPHEIEFSIGWTLADGKLYAAAVRAGFIDELFEGDKVARRVLHNWMEQGRTGEAIAKVEKAARLARERKRRWNDDRENAANERRNANGTLTERSADDETLSESVPEDGKNGHSIPFRSPPDLPSDSSGVLSPLAQTRDPSAPRTGYELMNVFGALWSKRYDRMWLGQPMAAKPASQFMDRTPAEIDRLAPLIRPALANFFADQRQFYLDQAHPLSLFVKDFDVHSGGGSGRAPPSRDVRVGHAMAEVKQRVSGEVKL